MSATLDPLNLIPAPLYAWAYFAVVLATALYGVTLMQTFFYYVHYPNDHLRLKVFVTVIWVVNTIHEALIVAGAYKYIAAALANPLAILVWIPELIAQIIPTAVVAVLSQGFLMHRVYLFSGRRIITLIVWLVLGLLQIVPFTIYVAKALYTADGSVHVVDITVLNASAFKITVTMSLAVAAAEDILICMFLVHALIRERTSTLLTSTAHILQRLTIFAVNTGSWTALFALLSLVFLYALPSEMLYAVFSIPLCAIYCNTVLANLNARVYMRGGSGAEPVSIDLLGRTLGPDRRRGEAKLIFPPPKAAAQRTPYVVTSSDTNGGSTVSEDA